MAEDRIIVDIESQIDMEIAKLQMYLSQSQQAFGTRNIVQGAERTQRATEQLQFRLKPVTDEMEILRYRLAQLGMHDLPSLNREMRVMIGLLPGGRQAAQAYFRFKREYAAVGEIIGAGMTGPAVMGLILTTITTLILVVRTIENQIKRMQQRQREHDRWVRGVMGMSREEYKRQLKLWEHYARSNPG